MENMLHLSAPHTSVPERYVFPRDNVPSASSSFSSLPVIDLSGARDEVRRAVLDAGKEMGFFQVVNHGVPEQTVRDMEEVCEEFFRLPAADKAGVYSEDKRRPNRLFSGTTYYDTGGEMYWRDCLRLVCPVAGDDSATMDDWPDKPHRLRKVVESFAMATRGVAMAILRLLCEAMGLRPDYFEGGLTGGHTALDVNHYPPCPDPSVTLGLPPHCDRALITVLLPGAVPGLEVANGNGGWVKVRPVPGAFVVNFGDRMMMLQVVTNGMLKSIEHRAVTNASMARTSVATFISPAQDCLVGPVEELLGEDNPPCYRAMTFSEFNRVYSAVNLGSSINVTTNLKNVQKQDLKQNH